MSKAKAITAPSIAPQAIVAAAVFGALCLRGLLSNLGLLLISP